MLNPGVLLDPNRPMGLKRENRPVSGPSAGFHRAYTRLIEPERLPLRMEPTQLDT